MKYDIFISYRRDGGEMTARIIRDRLTELGYSVFFDVETLRNGDFNTGLYEQIDNCKDFLLILSPGSLDRCVSEGDWVRREVEYALMKGKNIVPILLRGFSFPDALPASLQQLPYQNGIEANSQFFDAFIEKLQTFLVTKPTITQRIKQSRLLRKALPLLLALTVLLGAVIAGRMTCRNSSQNDNDISDKTYPHTAAEVNLTEECLYYIEKNLTYINIIADATKQAFDAAQHFLQTKNKTDLDDAFEHAFHTIENTDFSAAAPGYHFLDKLESSPFQYADFIAMHDYLINYQKDCLDTLQYIQELMSPDFMLTDSEKLEIIDSYWVFLEEDLNAIAYCTNLMLLPVTYEDYLTNFWNTVLSQLRHIPLRKASWSTDRMYLEQAIDDCFDNEEHVLADLETILGNSNREAAQEKEKLIQAYEGKGYARADAEKMVELVLAGYSNEQPEYIVIFEAKGYTRNQALDIWSYAQQGYTVNTAKNLVDYELLDPATAQAGLADQLVQQGHSEAAAQDLAKQLIDLEELKYTLRLKFCGLTTDDPDTLWAKMIKMKDAMQYEEAVECLELFQLASEDNPNQVKGAASAILLLQNIENGGIDHGIVVMGYGEQAHPVLRSGDIIIAFNGESCATAQDYIDRKAALTGINYTVTVLRPENGTLTQLELELTTEMPPIAIYALATD